MSVRCISTKTGSFALFLTLALHPLCLLNESIFIFTKDKLYLPDSNPAKSPSVFLKLEAKLFVVVGLMKDINVDSIEPSF